MTITLQQLNKKNGDILLESDLKKIDDNSTLIQNTVNTLPTESGSFVTTSTTNGNIIIDGSEMNVYTHPSGTNPHGTTASDIGLGNVTNESKATMFTSPVLTGVPTVPTAVVGTNDTQISNTAFVANAVANLINSSPATLDTLNELAMALGNDPNFATTMTTTLGLKAPLSSPTLTGTPTTPTATAGTNTTQIASTAFVQTGLSSKANSSHTHTKSQITDLPVIPTIVALTANEYSVIGSPDPNTLYLIKV